MSDNNEKDAKQNAEQTLLTLDQLSQTLEVMSCVVDRLKDQLTRQVSHKSDLFQSEEEAQRAEEQERSKGSDELRKESFVVEIAAHELEDGSDPTVH